MPTSSPLDFGDKDGTQTNKKQEDIEKDATKQTITMYKQINSNNNK